MNLEKLFKFPFYRIFFSLIIGIIALEGFILGYNYKFKNNNQTIDGILVKIQEQYSKSKYKKKDDTEEKDKKKDTEIKRKPENLKVEIGKYKVYIKFNSWSGYVFFTYCLFTTLVGEIFCSTADILLGFLFGYNPIFCEDFLENCLPWEENSGNSEDKNTNLKIKVSDLKNLEEKILEFSEMHFILSRNMAGLALVLSILFSLLSPTGLIITIANLSFLILHAIYRDSYSAVIISIITIVSIIYLLTQTVILGIFTSFILGLEILSIIYRIQANRIIIHSINKERIS